MTTKPNLITPEEAAKYLGISHLTLAKWRSAGRTTIPFIRVGKCIRYSSLDLDAWLIKNTHNKLEA
jgi:excisionase family DNA binding protein